MQLLDAAADMESAARRHPYERAQRVNSASPEVELGHDRCLHGEHFGFRLMVDQIVCIAWWVGLIAIAGRCSPPEFTRVRREHAVTTGSDNLVGDGRAVRNSSPLLHMLLTAPRTWLNKTILL